jgi:hypothetical protein
LHLRRISQRKVGESSNDCYSAIQMLKNHPLMAEGGGDPFI